MKTITVIGSGAWGTAIANLLAINSNQVFLSAIEDEVIEEINFKHTNASFLPAVKLSENLKAVKGFEGYVEQSDLIFIVTPSSAVLSVLTKISQLKLKENCGFMICSKGIEQGSLKFLSHVFSDVFNSENYAVLSGPNFAIEVANQVPTITTIATKNKNLFQEAAFVLNNENFKVEHSQDPKTAEICSVVKNVMAIGCGIIDGLDLGVNAKSALIMKGVQEIKLLCHALDASDQIDNAAGFGDIFLTCSSTKSRNNSLGVLIAAGKSYDNVVLETGKTYEGVLSSHSIVAIAKKLKLQLDLCEQISEILATKFTPEQIKLKITKAILS